MVICRVCAHVFKNRTQRFYIYSRCHFVWVVCAIIYINKKTNLKLNQSQFLRS